MNKIFTLALAAAATLGANAAAHQPNFGLHKAQLGTEAKVHPMKAIESDFSSRADEEELDITGTYVYGTYSIIFYSQQPEAMFIDNWVTEPMQIIANPAVENGYIIRNFMSEFWNGGLEENERFSMNDINATWNPETKQLTIAPYQTLFHQSFTDNATGQPVEMDMHIIGVVGENFSEEGTVVLDYSMGLFSLAENCYGFSFGEMRANGQIYGPGYQFGGFNAYIPNGSYRVHTDALGDQMDFPILGVWKESPIRNSTTGELITYTKFYVVNFSGFDMLRVVPLVQCVEDNRVMISSIFGYTGWQLLYYPAENPNLNFNKKYYAGQVDSKGEPIGDQFDLFGTIEECTVDQVRVTFPTYGLFDELDALWGDALWEDGELTFVPNKITGIQNVAAAADNANAPVVYYNLQGMRVNNPANGVFIRVQGNETSKVLVK